MTANEIREKIDQLEDWINWELYADFVRWDKLGEARRQISILQKQLKALEG